MDQSEQEQQQQQPLVGVVAEGGQMTYAPSCCQTAPMVASGTLAIAIPSSTQLPVDFSSSPHQLANQQSSTLPPSTAAATTTSALIVLN